MEIALIIALMVFAGHSFTWDNQIFEGVRSLIDEDSKIAKPIYNCPICMTPWWGTLFLWIIWNIAPWTDARHWFYIIGAATGLNVFSVIAVAVKDYCNSRNLDKKTTCCNGKKKNENKENAN